MTDSKILHFCSFWVILSYSRSPNKVKSFVFFSAFANFTIVDYWNMGPLTALNELDDKRIKCIKPLIPPQILMEDIPLTLKAAQTIVSGRQSAENIIKGQDDRLLVVVGPCSIHDVNAAKEYGKAWEDNTPKILSAIPNFYALS